MSGSDQPGRGVLRDQTIELTSARSCTEGVPRRQRRVVYCGSGARRIVAAMWPGDDGQHNVGPPADRLPDIYKSPGGPRSPRAPPLFFKWIREAAPESRRSIFVASSKAEYTLPVAVMTTSGGGVRMAFNLLLARKFVMRLRGASPMLHRPSVNCLNVEPCIFSPLFTTPVEMSSGPLWLVLSPKWLYWRPWPNGSSTRPILARTVEASRRSSVNLFKGHTTSGMSRNDFTGARMWPNGSSNGLFWREPSRRLAD